METFKSKFNHLHYIKDDNNRCYILDDPIRNGQFVSGKPKVKRRISLANYELDKLISEQHN